MIANSFGLPVFFNHARFLHTTHLLKIFYEYAVQLSYWFFFIYKDSFLSQTELGANLFHLYAETDNKIKFISPNKLLLKRLPLFSFVQHSLLETTTTHILVWDIHWDIWKKKLKRFSSNFFVQCRTNFQKTSNALKYSKTKKWRQRQI